MYACHVYCTVVHVQLFVKHPCLVGCMQVPEQQVIQAAGVIKRHMEAAAHLQVPLRVKLHVGPSWGQLEEYCISEMH